jgi:septal ring factor EnvC (AmiA/AmiB activator)
VSRRSVQGYVRRGLLEAQEQGQGVNKTFLVSIDSLNALHDRRRREASEAAKFAEASAEAVKTANQYTNIGEALRHAIERVEARTAEATELRIRLELTEQAQSTLQEELFEERRLREGAERERDELRRRLESPPSESPETVDEHQGRGQARSDAPGAQEDTQPRSWWRRMLGR